MYEDLEQQVDHLPRILDYESTPDENLGTLLTWTGKPYGGAEPGAEKIRMLIRDLKQDPDRKRYGTGDEADDPVCYRSGRGNHGVF